MRWPWISKATHRRIYIEQGEAYRREIEEARREAEKARADLRRFADSLAPRIYTDRPFPEQNLRITVEVDHRLPMVKAPQHDLLVLVRDGIMRRLVNLDRDYRGDLRQTEMQRLLGA